MVDGALPGGLGLLLEEGEAVLDPGVDLLHGHPAAGPAVDCKLEHGHRCMEVGPTGRPPPPPPRRRRPSYYSDFPPGSA